MNSQIDDNLETILVVEDDKITGLLLARLLNENQYRCEIAATAEEAIQKLEISRYCLVIVDIQLPQMNGIQLLDWILKKDPEIAVIITTSLEEVDVAVQCMKKGAYDYFTKPVHPEEFLIGVSRALERRRYLLREKDYKKQLETEIQDRTRDLEQTVHELQTAKRKLESRVSEIIYRLSLISEYRDEDTWFHLLRISDSSHLLAKKMSLSPEFYEMLRLASPLHDVGKVGIPDSILLKSGKLTEEEYGVMKSHTLIGAKILEGSNYPLINLAHTIALDHHERYDGSGYPRSLKNGDIPLAARIVAVVDVYDALRTERPYKPVWTVEKAVETIRSEREKHFDPEVVDVFLDSVDQINAFRIQHEDLKRNQKLKTK